MIFADNPTILIIPFGEVSLFFKFYTLRNTDRPASIGIDTLEFSIVNDDTIVYFHNFPTKRLRFINHKFFIQDMFIYPAELRVLESKNKNHNGFGSANLKIITYSIEILPNIFVQLESSGINNNDILDLSDTEISIVRFDKESKETIISQNYNFINNTLVNSIIDYNKYLYSRLQDKQLWHDFALDRCIDIPWIEDNILVSHTNSN